jgi:DNA polymerase III alpha subunit
MRTDNYGQQIYNEMELCLLYLQDPSRTINKALVENEIKFDEVLQLENAPELIQYNKLDMTVEQFDNQMQSNWLMPEQYKTMDIAKWVLDQCKDQDQLQRVGAELLEFQRRNMMDLLRWLKYFVDYCRDNKILWGVGRGSSVASYVLYLIGVHKIDPLKYNLDWQDFLR